MSAMVRALWNYRGFILGSVKREFQSKYRNSLLGAAWIDGGIEAARAIYARLFHGRAGALEAEPWHDNPKGELQARVQAGEPALPVYTLLSVDGPEHAPLYRVQVEAAGCRAVVEGCSKQAAEKAAARAWLLHYGAYLPETTT